MKSAAGPTAIAEELAKRPRAREGGPLTKWPPPLPLPPPPPAFAAIADVTAKAIITMMTNTK
ncbi:hypothetical protein CCACVL1_15242, partial [Corchorus capsularis]